MHRAVSVFLFGIMEGYEALFLVAFQALLSFALS